MSRKQLILLPLIVISALIAGCEEEVTLGDWPLPPEMSHCSVYLLQNKNGGMLTAVYCPHADVSVTYQQGKTQTSVLTINGKKYKEIVDGDISK